MRYWFDTEFIENGSTIDLISIGIVAEDGREFYAQNQQCDFTQANDWVVRNVLIHLVEYDMGNQMPMRAHGLSGRDYKLETGGWWRESKIWRMRSEIAKEIVEFVGQKEMDDDKFRKPEIWAYYADYDWVALCQLFGTMMDLPKGWPMYCRDIKQWCDQLGNPKLPEQGKGEHNALADARWNKQAWDFLNGLTF